MSQFNYTFTLPPVGASDVANRELTVTVNNTAPPQVFTFPGQPMTTGVVGPFNDGDHLSLTLVDIDGHGNRSPSSAALDLDVVDDVAPAQPGNLSVASKTQV